MQPAGDVAFVSRGIDHAFKATGTDEGRHIVIPASGGFMIFFENMAAHGQGDSIDNCIGALRISGSFVIQQFGN